MDRRWLGSHAWIGGGWMVAMDKRRVGGGLSWYRRRVGDG